MECPVINIRFGQKLNFKVLSIKESKVSKSTELEKNILMFVGNVVSGSIGIPEKLLANYVFIISFQ